MIFLQLFLTFLQIGAFTFGGGYAMLPMIQQQVAAHGWMTSEELVNFVAISESSPGPFAINISTYVGAETGGPLGALCATLGVVLPSFIIILIVAKFYIAFKKNYIIKGCMAGLKPVVIGLIAAAIISVGLTSFFPTGFAISMFTSYLFWTSVIIFAGMLILQIKKISPILIILISAVLGIGFGYLQEVI